MVRFAIIGVIIGAALVLYALVDAAMSDPARARGVAKPVWVVLIVVLPVIGAVLWFAIGKGRGPAPARSSAPDDDPRFTGARLSSEEIDAHVEELEARLRELDEEVFPQVDGAGSEGTEGKTPGGKPASPGSNDAAGQGGDTSGEPR